MTDIDRAHALALLRQMLLIRRFEEKAAELYSVGKIRGFLHLYIGEEAVAVGAMQALTPEDGIVATYREHGQALARGIPAGSLMAEMYGKANGCSRGRGGSMHFFDVSRRFFGGHAIVGGGLPVAVGLALADKLTTQARVTACFFGDGAVAEGEFHESLNLAALWKLPVLFICENNLYAMGTALARHQAQPDIRRKADAYGKALAALHEDTLAAWSDVLGEVDAEDLDDSDDDDDHEPYQPDARSLRRFLEEEVMPWYGRRRRELESRNLIRTQAFGEALEPDRLATLARYEVHLDRKLERVLGMLLKLQDLRRTITPDATT